MGGAADQRLEGAGGQSGGPGGAFGEHLEGPADGVQVAVDVESAPVAFALRRGVSVGVDEPGGAVVDPADGAQVDDLDLPAVVDDVLGLHVAVQQAPVVQVLQGAEDLAAVGDDVPELEAAGAEQPRQLLLGGEADPGQGPAADVLHHDVAGRFGVAGYLVLDVGDDADDVAVVQRGERAALLDGRPAGHGVAGVDQALEDDVQAGHPGVLGEVDPAVAADGEVAEHRVVPGDPVSGAQLRPERVLGPALGAEPVVGRGAAVVGDTDGAGAVVDAAAPAAGGGPGDGVGGLGGVRGGEVGQDQQSVAVQLSGGRGPRALRGPGPRASGPAGSGSGSGGVAVGSGARGRRKQVSQNPVTMMWPPRQSALAQALPLMPRAPRAAAGRAGTFSVS